MLLNDAVDDADRVWVEVAETVAVAVSGAVAVDVPEAAAVAVEEGAGVAAAVAVRVGAVFPLVVEHPVCAKAPNSAPTTTATIAVLRLAPFFVTRESLPLTPPVGSCELDLQHDLAARKAAL